MFGKPALIGSGAGLASALLYAAAASGSPIALALLYVAPLPILLAAVGWRHTAGLVATVAGAALLALAIGPKTAAFFIVAVGLPSWWLAYLALLARTSEEGAPAEWYPVGRLVLWCAGLGALLVAASIPLVATSLEDYQASLRAIFEKAFEAPGGAPAPTLPGGQDPKQFIALMSVIAPSLAAGVWTLASVLNLWLAGRITRASGRLARPWPYLPGFEFPRRAPLWLAGGVAFSFLPGLAGLIAELFAGTFLIAFALLGLAVVHVIAASAPARALILFAVYGLLLIQPWIMAALAMLGLAEHFLAIRSRFGPPPPSPTAPANLP